MIVLLLALAFDLALGELPAAVHPVVWIGRASAALERVLPGRGRWALPAGVLLGVCLPALVGGLAWVALHASGAQPLVHGALSVLLLTSSFSIRMLASEGRAVGLHLERGDLAAARLRLRSLCSRDVRDLERGEVASAAISSLAENTVDSALAPLLFWSLAGVPGALIYRTINTLDARVGYRGARAAFGWASARLDDVANLVPARAGALFLLAVGALVGGSPARGVRILRRDRGRTPSPNGGWPMSAVSGLLGVRLEKRGVYALGAEFPWPDAPAIRAAARLSIHASLAGALACAALARGVGRV